VKRVEHHLGVGDRGSRHEAGVATRAAIMGLAMRLALKRADRC
jgi:hypothetical protein